MTIILAGDIGGTKTLLQLVEKTAGQIEILAELKYDSQAYPDFQNVLAAFRHDSHFSNSIDAACIGVAGPVDGRRASVTNLPWELDALLIETRHLINKVAMLNDFQVIGYGIDSLVSKDLFVIQKGNPVQHGTRAIIGAGTGLGEGLLVWQKDRYAVLPSQGGHVDFAPTNNTQDRLLQFMRKRFSHVSYELVLSGPGLENIYRFLRFENESKDSSAMSIKKMLSASEITQAALASSDELAVQALALFLGIYGAQAGNLALTTMATGGVFVAGGIAPRIKHLFLQDDFIRAFHAKGKMDSLMVNFPITLIDNPRVGLLGAQEYAFYLAG